MNDSVTSDIEHFDALSLSLLPMGFGFLGIGDENIEVVVKSLE